MNQKELSRLNYKNLKLAHLKKRIMTITNISYMLAKLMKNHIGIANAIRMEDLFKEIYEKERQPDYVDDFRWDYVRKAMHRLRQSEKCFIVGVKLPHNNYSYFIPTNFDEAMIYVKVLENNIGRQRQMQEKVVKSVNEGWYKLDWVAESKTLSAYEEIINKKQKQRELILQKQNPVQIP